MGAQWKQAGKVQNSSKRSAIVGKLAKEIIVAAKIGDPSPDNNSRLRAAIESAKRASVPRDTIERAIKKGAGLLDDAAHFETVLYEGFAPHQVAVIVECLTDNKNRTASDIRLLFRKAQLGSVGSVGWMFDRLGVIEATHPDGNTDLEEVAIEAGAQNVEKLDAEATPSGHAGGRFICDPTDLDTVNRALTLAGWVITQSELSYIPKSPKSLPPEERKEVAEFLDSVDENDDVHRLYVAMI